MPLTTLRLQLMDPAVIGVEKIVSVREHPGVKGMYRTPSPSRRFQTPTVLHRIGSRVNSELDLILDTGRLCRNQSPASFN
jgi:hypothetical protein